MEILMPTEFVDWETFFTMAPLELVERVINSFKVAKQPLPAYSGRLINNVEFSWEFLEKYQDILPWDYIIESLPNVPMEILTTPAYINKVNWARFFFYNPTISQIRLEEFKLIPERYYLNLPLTEEVFGHRIPEDILQYILDKIPKEDRISILQLVDCHSSITQSFLMKNFEKLENYIGEILDCNAKNFTEDFFKEEKFLIYMKKMEETQQWSLETIIHDWRLNFSD
jgi:hypothetical protein